MYNIEHIISAYQKFKRVFHVICICWFVTVIHFSVSFRLLVIHTDIETPSLFDIINSHISDYYSEDTDHLGEGISDNDSLLSDTEFY